MSRPKGLKVIRAEKQRDQDWWRLVEEERKKWKREGLSQEEMDQTFCEEILGCGYGPPVTDELAYLKEWFPEAYHKYLKKLFGRNAPPTIRSDILKELCELVQAPSLWRGPLRGRTKEQVEADLEAIAAETWEQQAKIVAALPWFWRAADNDKLKDLERTKPRPPAKPTVGRYLIVGQKLDAIGFPLGERKTAPEWERYENERRDYSKKLVRWEDEREAAREGKLWSGFKDKIQRGAALAEAADWCRAEDARRKESARQARSGLLDEKATWIALADTRGDTPPRVPQPRRLLFGAETEMTTDEKRPGDVWETVRMRANAPETWPSMHDLTMAFAMSRQQIQKRLANCPGRAHPTTARYRSSCRYHPDTIAWLIKQWLMHDAPKVTSAWQKDFLVKFFEGIRKNLPTQECRKIKRKRA